LLMARMMELDTARDALEFYAHVPNWQLNEYREHIVMDVGDRAREALAKLGGSNEP